MQLALARPLAEPLLEGHHYAHPQTATLGLRPISFLHPTLSRIFELSQPRCNVWRHGCILHDPSSLLLHTHRAAGIPEDSILKWDLPETKIGGPFTEIAESDIFINCVYLGPHKIPPFVTYESLAIPSRRLRVICDVSCDPNSENNPIPLYSSYSSFSNPTTTVSDPSKIDGPELRIIAIDHLPTLVARESSDEYSGLLLPSLLDLDKRNNAEDGVWQRAEAIFKDRVSQLPENMR